MMSELYLISKLEFIGREHDDVVIHGQYGLRFDLVKGQKPVCQPV